MNFQAIKVSEQERKLISDFMGENYPDEIDFNWLMPVVEKISKHEIKGIAPFNSDQYVMVEIVPYGYVKISNLRDTPITTNVSVEGSLINAIYKAVVQFIQWYNDNLKNQQP